MKRLFLLILCSLLVCTACTKAPDATENTPEPSGTSEPAAESAEIPQELIAVWVSADAGELEMVETITFGEGGYLEVGLNYRGSDYGTLYGTYTVEGHTIYCSITEGAEPYQVEYSYQIDGRMLILYDDDGTAEYLRTS